MIGSAHDAKNVVQARIAAKRNVFVAGNVLSKCRPIIVASQQLR